MALDQSAVRETRTYCLGSAGDAIWGMLGVGVRRRWSWAKRK